MSYKGSEFEFKQERDADLLKSYKDAIEKASYPFLLHDILVSAVTSPSERFWVSAKRATLVILRMKSGESISSMKKNKQLMYQEIYRRVIELEEKHSDLPLLKIVDTVVEQKAPCFYMTPESAQVIIHYAKKRCLEKKLKQLRYYW